jgi:hypothetical protein
MPASVQVGRCHRCLQPVPVKARRCPHCGDIQVGDSSRKLTLFLGVLGVIIIIAIVGLGFYLTPPAVDTENNPEAQAPAPPPKPVKKPPLN